MLEYSRSFHVKAPVRFDQAVLEKMDQSALRAIAFYEFLQGRSARSAATNMCSVFNSNVVHHSTIARWFERFRSGDITFEDKPRSGRPTDVNDEELRSLLRMKPNASSRQLADELGCSHPTILEHFKKYGYRKVLSSWIPHELSKSNKATRVSICLSLLLHPHRKDFLSEIVTGDESWVLYVNHTRKRQWLPQDEKPKPTPKPTHTEKKVLFCCWWDSEGMLFYELLPPNTTINAETYSSQLRNLSAIIKQKRRKRLHVRLLHDNARPHIAKLVKQTISELGWEVLPHPPYSPDLAPSDYHLFRALKNYLRDKQFDDQTDLQNTLEEFFDSKPKDFWMDGIQSLPGRWARVVDEEGEYISN